MVIECVVDMANEPGLTLDGRETGDFPLQVRAPRYELIEAVGRAGFPIVRLMDAPQALGSIKPAREKLRHGYRHGETVGDPFRSERGIGREHSVRHPEHTTIADTAGIVGH